MSYGRNAHIGAGEVTDLIGRWQQIVGAQPWHQIVGAETYYPQYQQQQPFQQQQPQQSWWHRRHHRGWPSVRDHRRAWLYQAYASGDPSAVGALALMGAEDVHAAQTGVPPADATVPAPPEAAAAAAAAPPAPMPGTMPPPPPPMPPVPPPMPPGMEHHHHHHHRQHRTNAPGGNGNGRSNGNGWNGPPPGYGYEIGPRNAMIDYAGPSRADRVVLPMSSGVNILPNTSAQITSRPQNVAFRPERLIIGGTPGDWIINDIKVGNRSQFSQSGDVPGEMFAATTIDSFVSFETVQTAMDFVVLVTFVGASESGAPFVCGVLGTAAI